MAKKKGKSVKSDVGNGLACAVLSYLLIGIIWFFADEKMKKNNFAKFHVKQALVLLVAAIVFSVAYGIVFTILAAILIFIPVAGLVLIYILGLIFWLPAVWAVIGIVYSATGKQKKLPVIGNFADKLKF